MDGVARRLTGSGRPIDLSDRLDTLIERLRRQPGRVAVLIYGSYGTQYQTPLSDADFALILGEEPSLTPSKESNLLDIFTLALREDDVSVIILNRAPLALRHKVLAEGLCLMKLDELAYADFVEKTIRRYQDFSIDESRFLQEYDRALLEDCLGAC